jgi:hypothetical protein
MKISKLSFVGIVLLLTLASFGVVSACSCTPGFWKAPQHRYTWEGLIPTDNVAVDSGSCMPRFFDLDGVPGYDSNLQALSYKGGPGIQGAQRIFLRAWVANQLNVPYGGYELFTSEEAFTILTTYDRAGIIHDAEALDYENNFGICDVLEQYPLPG